MLSINMRIFKTVLLIAFFGASVRCFPTGDEPQSNLKVEIPATPTIADAPESSQLDSTYYDQRQNGSENYRIHVDGVVLVFAPAETLFLAAAGASNLSLSDYNGGSLTNLGSEKPIADVQYNKTDLASSKTIHKPPFRLANWLGPLLRRLHSDQGINVH